MGAQPGTALQVPLADGRGLEVVLCGPEEGVPVIVHLGTTGAAGVSEPMPRGSLGP